MPYSDAKYPHNTKADELEAESTRLRLALNRADALNVELAERNIQLQKELSQARRRLDYREFYD